MTKLSIITPVYQNEKVELYVQEKVRSKFPDSELVIAEDGSKDNTRKILKSIQSKYNITLDLCDDACGDIIFFL